MESDREHRSPFVVLLTGHPAAGKSTLARPLASALRAVCLSKDQVRFRVFDGWKPSHPRLGGQELRVGTSVFDEDAVVWSTFFWAVRETVEVAPVVAETAMTRTQNRVEVASFVTSLDVPAVEVLLSAPPEALIKRHQGRLAKPETHAAYRQFPTGTADRLLGKPYKPLLDARAVVDVDATVPSEIDVQDLAHRVRQRVSRLRGSSA